jgi:hypothetical protein
MTDITEAEDVVAWIRKREDEHECLLAELDRLRSEREVQDAALANLRADLREAVTIRDAELDRLRAEAASWEQQAQDRTDDALKFAAERDALKAEINRLCPSSWDENARAWAEELRSQE